MIDNCFIDQGKKSIDKEKIRRNPYFYISVVEHTEENCLLAVSLSGRSL